MIPLWNRFPSSTVLLKGVNLGGFNKNTYFWISWWKLDMMYFGYPVAHKKKITGIDSVFEIIQSCSFSMASVFLINYKIFSSQNACVHNVCHQKIFLQYNFLSRAIILFMCKNSSSKSSQIIFFSSTILLLLKFCSALKTV